MILRAPDANLPPPGAWTWAAGTPWHRIHASVFAPTAFNPCQGRPTRFAPLRDAAGTCVPTLYAASTFDAACYETLFHDVGQSGRFKTIPLSDVEERDASVIAPRRDLKLAALFAPELVQWQLSRADLIGTSAAQYLQTVRWAEAIHAQFPDLDGLVWTSNRCDPDLACLLFGDRVGEADLDPVARRSGADDPSVRADVRRAGQRGGIVLVA